MIENQDKRGSLLVRWKEGQLANRSTSATVALSVILVATIIVAKAIVVERSGALIAQENAATLTEHISEVGLEQILGRYPLEMTYLFEKDQKPIGYGVYLLESEVDRDGKLSYVGKELVYRSDFEELSYSVFSVANDLSRFTQKKTIRRVSAGTHHVMLQAYRDGVLGGQVQVGQRLYSVAPYRVDEPGLIAPFLIDFFSSLGLRENYSEGVAFLLPKIARQSESSWVFHLEKNWVQSSDEIPSAVVDAAPGGQGCSIETAQLSASNISQTLYFNDEHQLVWQRIRSGQGGELVFRAVDRRDILNHFPDALEILDRWRSEPDEPNDEGEHEIL